MRARQTIWIGLIILAASTALVYWISAQDAVTRRKENQQLQLPSEALVLLTGSASWGSMSKSTIRFTLPDSRPPDQWLRVIASNYHIKNYHHSRFLYRYRYKDGMVSITYLPSARVYEVESISTDH